MANGLDWLKELLGLNVPPSARPQSIVERLEGLIPPVKEIETAYNVDRRVALAGHNAMLAIEKLIKATLKEQQQAIEFSELLIEQQATTAGIIEGQVDKAANADTIINNFRIFLTEDELTIQWILENIITPALFATAFGRQEPGRQRELFNALRKVVNNLQKQDGMLNEPHQPPQTSSTTGGL